MGDLEKEALKRDRAFLWKLAGAMLFATCIAIGVMLYLAKKEHVDWVKTRMDRLTGPAP